MPYRNSIVILAAAGLLAGGAVVGGCAPHKPTRAQMRGGRAAGERAESKASIDKEAVVVVDGEEISLGELERRIGELPEYARARYATIEQKQSYLDSVAQFEVMADVAERDGLGDRPEVYWAMKQAMADDLVDEAVRKERAEIGRDEITAYYEAHPDEFHTPAGRHVALITIATREEAATVRKRVLAEMDEADDGPIHAFRRSAAAYSTARASAQKGGDIGFVQPPDAGANDTGSSDSEQAHPEIAKQVFALDHKGEVTPVFALDGRWALATFFEEREASSVDLDEAAGEIRKKLAARRRDDIEGDFVASLRDGADIDVDQALVGEAQQPPAPAPSELDDIPLHAEAPFGVKQSAQSGDIDESDAP